MKMRKRTTIVLEKEDLKILEPLIEKNNGNVSAAIREIIRGYQNKREKSIRDALITRGLAIMLPMSFFIWFIRETKEKNFPPELCMQIIKRYSKVLNFSIEDLKNPEKYNEFIKIMGYPAKVSISGKEELDLTFEGHSSDILDFLIDFTASLYAMPPFNLKLINRKESPTMVNALFKK